MSDAWGFETRQIHVGGDPDPTTGARAVPIYQTTSYDLGNSARAANLFALAEVGNIYTRIMNPTQGALEARLNALEGGCTTAIGIPGTLVVASGQASEMLAITTIHISIALAIVSIGFGDQSEDTTAQKTNKLTTTNEGFRRSKERRFRDLA